MNRNEQIGMVFMALVCAACVSKAQPTNDRLFTEWRATNANETWCILDDGGRTPLLSGRYNSNTIYFDLLPAAFDYGDNKLRTMAVGRGEKRQIEIRYVGYADDVENVIDAQIRSKRVRFYKQ